MKVPDVLVEKLALGELDEAEAARVRAALGEDADARLAALKADDAKILAELPPTEVAAEVARRVARQESAEKESASRGLSWWIGAGTLAAAAAGVAWLWLAPASAPPSVDGDRIARGDDSPVVGETGEQVLLKGDARLWIEHTADGRPEKLADGAFVERGDRLQVHYHGGGATQGVIVSIDGRGAATLHFPDTEDAARTLATGPVQLDHSYELDDAPKFERFFFVTAGPDAELSAAEVMAAARTLAEGPDAATGELDLPEGLQQRSISLRKR